MLEFTKKERTLFKKLNTPAKVQDFLNSLPFNFEKKGETLKSPVLTLRSKSAHCMEGALLGAYILSTHGFKSYLLCLKTTRDDYDHVVAPFKKQGLWGALSKTNHNVLRYREPVYRNIHELAISYFHEYFLQNRRKTLRRRSALFNLNSLPNGWEISGKNLWSIDQKLNRLKYYDIVPKSSLRSLRKVDRIEIRAGNIEEYKSR